MRYVFRQLAQWWCWVTGCSWTIHVGETGNPWFRVCRCCRLYQAWCGPKRGFCTVRNSLPPIDHGRDLVTVYRGRLRLVVPQHLSHIWLPSDVVSQDQHRRPK